MSHYSDNITHLMQRNICFSADTVSDMINNLLCIYSWKVSLEKYTLFPSTHLFGSSVSALDYQLFHSTFLNTVSQYSAVSPCSVSARFSALYSALFLLPHLPFSCWAPTHTHAHTLPYGDRWHWRQGVCARLTPLAWHMPASAPLQQSPAQLSINGPGRQRSSP